MCKSMLYALTSMISLVSVYAAYGLAPHHAVNTQSTLRVELPMPNSALDPEYVDNLCSGILPVVSEPAESDHEQECVAALLRSGITMNPSGREVIQQALFGVQNKRKSTRNKPTSVAKPRTSKYKGKPQDGAGR